MPVATVSQEAVRFALKTAPPDGYVELIPLPFGKLLHRRDRATKMSMQQQARRSKTNKRATEATEDGNLIGIEFANEWSREYEFKECIVDHNLTDANGNKLDFRNQMAIKFLNPKIGQEIEKYLDELNREEDEDDAEDFPSLSASSSLTENGTDAISPIKS